MEYKKPNQKMIEQYLKKYLSAKGIGSPRLCYLGKAPHYRIKSRDSYIRSLTDPQVFLLYVLYPRFVDGDTEIINEAKKMMKEFAESEKPEEFYQAFCFLCDENGFKKEYEKIPFQIFDEEILTIMKSRIPVMKKKLQEYREDDFGKYISTMYDTVIAIIENNPFFMD